MTADGILDETHWVELKKMLPPKGAGANTGLTRDLASLSVDGGAFVIGIEDNHGKPGAGIGANTEGFISRLDATAKSTVTPPPTITTTTIPHPTDPELAVLVATVPASAGAPHMVDNKYWGRGDEGKRPLRNSKSVDFSLSDRNAPMASKIDCDLLGSESCALIRYALMLELDRQLTDSEFAIHEVCDNPICVRATTSIAGRPHVVAGTQSQNLAGMSAKGRGGGRGQSWHWYGPDRAARAARSKALRDALRNGWGRRRGGIRVASHGHSDTFLTSERHEKMSENFTPRERSAVEAAAHQATKHTQNITDADLVAVVEGLTGISVAQTPRIDIAFPATGDPDELFH